MKVAYQWLARLIALGVLLQVAFITFGTFDTINTARDGRAFTGERDDYNTGQMLHALFGETVIPLLALLLLIVSFFAKVPRGVPLALGVFGLVVLQFLLALVSFEAPVVGLLHGINAFAIAGVAGLAGAWGSRGSRTETPAGEPA